MTYHGSSSSTMQLRCSIELPILNTALALMRQMALHCNASRTSQVYKYDENTKACTSMTMTPRHGQRSSHSSARPFNSSLTTPLAHMAHSALALGQEEAQSSTLGCIQRAPQGDDCNRTGTESSILYFQNATCI